MAALKTADICFTIIKELILHRIGSFFCETHEIRRRLMTGWLVVNEFVGSAKFDELFNMLEEAAQKENIGLIRKKGGEVWCMLAAAGYSREKLCEAAGPVDFVLFWDKDIKLAGALEGLGLPVFNSAEAIARCDDKALTFLELVRHKDIKMPKTIIAPKKFHADGLICRQLLGQVRDALGYPCVVKECLGSFGQQVYLAEDEDQLAELMKSIGDRGYMIQEYIESSKGHDIRVQVVGGRVVAAMYRYNDNDFRANVTNGGSMKPYEPDTAQIEMAVKVCEYLGLDFGGIDILFGKEGEPVLCEANSNAHFKNLYDCTGINTADAIMKYIREKITEN